MKFTNVTEIHDFMSTAESCEGKVWLESPNGDRFILNSVFSRYIAMAALLNDKAEELELFCQLPEDKAKFFKFFDNHPEV
jgi:hypothetical protein